MAKDKKAAKELTIEEKLAQALVPVEEQPYKIPENWCWVHLCDSFNNYTNSRKKIQSKEYQEKGKLAIVDQGRELIGGYTDDESMAYSGELPVIIFGDHTRCIKFIDFPFAQGADGVKVIEPKKFYDTKAFYYALQSIDIPNMGYRRHFSLFSQFAIPVPPFEEQCRIVDRIESIFTKLDEAKEKAQAVVDGFELRKSAILHKAFKGELTKQWREEHDLTLESWRNTKLGDTIRLLSGQDFKPEQYNNKNDGVPYITGASNFDETHVVINRWTPVPSVIAKKGDILLVCKGSGYGKTIIADFDKAHIARQIMAIRTNDNIINEYLLFYFRAQYEYFRNNGQGLIPGISRKVVLEMQVRIPTKNEQVYIVEQVKSIFNKEILAREAAKKVIDQIGIIKQAVLARAFHGELGTNDLTEEDAIELLKLAL